MKVVPTATWLHSLLASLLLTCTGVAHAEDYALLIGVADYPQLPRRLWLRGPVNDVELVRGLLLEKGFAAAKIQTLSSSTASNGQQPTRHNILAAFARLKHTVGPKDRVFLYFAGHGSQQPQPAQHSGRATEADGLDEVFLPADVSQWDGTGANAAIPNALLDDEIGEFMDALVDAGGTVWGVFDTCHAAGMSRGKSSTGIRAIHPSDLNLPVHPPKSSALASPTKASRRIDGRSLAFASRSHELAGEEWLPRGSSLAQARRHGVFTYHLVNALRRDKAITAATLDKAIRAEYASENRIAPVPQWLGEAKAIWP